MLMVRLAMVSDQLETSNDFADSEKSKNLGSDKANRR